MAKLDKERLIFDENAYAITGERRWEGAMTSYYAEMQKSNDLVLRDSLNDIMQGFQYWLKAKNDAGATDDHDEMFIRWMERHAQLYPY